MSGVADGTFGGAKPERAADGVVGFEVRPADDGDGWVATGGEPDFDGEGRAPTAALAIADYCVRYDEATRDGGGSDE